MPFKPLPIGVENFEQLITEGYYYIDKTLFIKELLDKKGLVNLFTRPRRFGKTLALSMFKYFFEKSNQDNSHLFNGLKIMNAGKEYLTHLGKYPVISLSLKSAKQPTFEMAYESIQREIRGEYERHNYLADSVAVTRASKKDYLAILDNTATPSLYTNSLKSLSKLLYQHYNQKVIILIDEYDVPLENAHLEDLKVNRGFYGKMVSFIRSLFESVLKTNDAVEFAVVTGCLRIAKESIFTGLNHFKAISILAEEYGEYFGFTQAEVSTMLEFYNRKNKEKLVKQWYNGYLFGNIEVYNPWSMVNFVNNLAANENTLPIPFWSNTSSNSIVRELVERADSIAKQEIETLIAGGSIEKPIQEDITYEDVYQTQNNLWNFLFFTGYLKKTGARAIGKENYITLTIPNNEIGYIYEHTVLDWFENKVKQKNLAKLYQAMLDGDVMTFTEEINQNLIETISFYDYGETFYQGFLAGLLRGMPNAIVTSNRETGLGRADIQIKILSAKEDRAIILELKVAPTFQALGEVATQALAQIDRQNYEASLIADGCTNIMKYGIAFFKKKCQIKTDSITTN